MPHRRSSHLGATRGTAVRKKKEARACHLEAAVRGEHARAAGGARLTECQVRQLCKGSRLRQAARTGTHTQMWTTDEDAKALVFAETYRTQWTHAGALTHAVAPRRTPRKHRP
eukprot:5208174-Pleurochrysis_carterae.AAC.2